MNPKHLKIGLRLALTFGLTCALTFALGLVADLGLHNVRATWQDVSGRTFVKVQEATRGRIAVGEAVHHFKNFLLRGGDYDQRFSADLTEIEKAVDAYRTQGSMSERESTLLKDISNDAKSYRDALAQVVKLKAGGTEITAIDKSIKGADGPLAQAFNALLQINQEASKQANDSMTATIDKTEWTLYGLVALTMVVSAFLAWRITLSITQPLQEAVDLAHQVAAGDLSGQVLSTHQDETGQLMRALQEMSSSLSHVVGRVRDGADSIAVASAQIAEGNHDLSVRTEEQASSLQQTSEELTRLSHNVKANADNARAARDHVAHASEVASKGGEVVSRVVETMEHINTSSRKIVEIISVIDGIAFQTNILALNAAVEAARAGEQGRGFAVVATEVRNLAQRSANAAKEIKGLIDTSVQEVDAGSKLVAEAGATMGDIVHSVERVSNIMREMAQASQVQDEGIETASSAVAQIDGSTQQNAALVEQAAAATASLRDQAESLTHTVHTFKLDS